MKLWIFIIAELQQVRSSFGLIVYNAAGCIIWISQSQEFTKANNSNLLCSWSSWSCGDKQTSPLTVLQPLSSIGGQQQVVRASSISWHSQSSISTRCWGGQPLHMPLSCPWGHISAVSQRNSWSQHNTWTDWSCPGPYTQTVSSLCSHYIIDRKPGHSPYLETELMAFSALFLPLSS